MKTTIYSYRSGKEVIPADICQGVIGLIERLDYNLGKYDITRFKADLADRLQMQGWSGKVHLSTQSNISITSILRHIGLCTQTGNMARMYADLLKLQALYVDEKIKAAVFVLPTRECANVIGKNIANYERFLNELTNIFSKVITVPMVIVGFGNEEEDAG